MTLGLLVLLLAPDAGRRETTFNVREIRLVRSVPLKQGRVYAVAFSPDGRRLAAGGGDGTAVVLDAERWTEIHRLKLHAGGVYGVAFSADGRRLATAGARDGKIRVWDVATGAPLREMASGGICYRLAFDPREERILVAGQGGAARILGIEGGATLATLAGHQNLSYACGFSRDGRRAATADAAGKIRIWRTSDWTAERTLAGRNGLIYALGFSRDGRRLLSGGTAGELLLWDVETGRQLLALAGQTGEVRCAGFTPDGRRVIAAGSGAVRVWDAARGVEERRLELRKGTAFELAVRPVGSQFAIAADGGVLEVYGDR